MLDALSQSRPLAWLAVAAAAGLLAIAGNPVSPVIPVRGAAPTPLSFATATVVDPVNLYGEPDLRSDPGKAGTWYASGPWGTGTQRSIWNQSTDGTHTFRELHTTPDPVHAGGSLCCGGGGDTEIAVDSSGKFYGADLAALASQQTYTSTDRGHTFQRQPLPDAFKDPSGSGTDRQWFGLWDPPNPAAARAASGYTGAFPVNYMVYLEALAVNSAGGEIVTSSVPVGTDSSNVGLNYACSPGGTGTATCPNWSLNNDGFVFLDQLTGKVVQAIDYQADANSPNQAAVEVLTPDAGGYMVQSGPKGPQRHTVYTLNNASTNALFPVAVEDAQRNAYYVWVERPGGDRAARSWQVYYSWSPPGANSDWNQWSAPIKVSTPPSMTAIMPWAVAGGNGVLDVAWYGTDQLLTNPEDETTSASANWYLYLAQVQNAATNSPTITQVKAVDHPMHHGSICLSGTGCILIQGNRNLADYFEISTDASGAGYIVYDNTANDLIDQAPGAGVPLPEGVVDHKGAELVHVVRQVGGASLNGGFINQPTDIGVSHIFSGRGDALYPAVAPSTNYPGLDILGTSLVFQDGNLLAQVQVDDLSQLTAAATGTGAQFLEFVVRWEYKSKLYFGAVELPLGQDTGLFYDGASQSIDLCSVSACDPHILTYPGPTVATTSHLITGQVDVAANTIRLTIPVGDVGTPQRGDHLDSVGAYSFASATSAFTPLPNSDAQADIVPVEVDGACCFTPTLGATVPGNGNGPGGAAGPTAGGGNGLPATATENPVRPLASAGLVLVLAGSATLLGRRRRRRAT